METNHGLALNLSSNLHVFGAVHPSELFCHFYCEPLASAGDSLQITVRLDCLSCPFFAVSQRNRLLQRLVVETSVLLRIQETTRLAILKLWPSVALIIEW